MNLAPICLFTYNRLTETQATVEALRENFLSGASELYIFSDGPKDSQTSAEVQKVREYIRTIDGFKNVYIKESFKNKGLANSVIKGVTEVINIHGKVIVLEDDLITSPNFLDFMNQALEFYKKKKIYSISGYSFDLPSLKFFTKDFYLGYRASSWGWGTWKNIWEEVDWEISDYNHFQKNQRQRKNFRRGGSDMPRMLKQQMEGKIDSWAIRWCYDQFRKDMLTVFPAISKVKSIGFGENATHTKSSKRFCTTLDTGIQRHFKFEECESPDQQLAKEFRDKFSLINRLKNKFL